MTTFLRNLATYGLPVAIVIVGFYGMLVHRRERAATRPAPADVSDELDSTAAAPQPVPASNPYPEHTPDFDDWLTYVEIRNTKLHLRCIRARRDGRQPCELCGPVLVGSAKGLPS